MGGKRGRAARLPDRQEKTRIACTKYRAGHANGWSFPPLAECRKAWEQIYGTVRWDNPASEWGMVEGEDVRMEGNGAKWRV